MKKTALITGASSGIGKDFAHIHAERGGDLIIVARSEDKLHALKSELESKYSVHVTVVAMDLSQSGAGKAVYDAVKAQNLAIDYLINNAGFGGIGQFHERDWAQDLAMINVNMVALTELTRCFLPDFIARNSGKVLNVSSTASLVPGPLQAVYFATKAYVTSLSNALAGELHNSEVTVTALLPGATETEFGKISGMDKTDFFAKTASSRQVAEAGYQAMLAGKLEVIAGLPLSQRILLKLSPLLPKQIALTMVRKGQEVR